MDAERDARAAVSWLDPRRLLVVALVLWGLSRLAFLIAYAGGRVTRDAAVYYIPVAKNLAQDLFFSVDGHVPTAYTAPLYPAFLAIVQRPFGFDHFWPIQLVQLALDAGTTVLLYRLARRLFRHPLAPPAVVLLYAAYLPAARSVASVLTETLFVFLMVLSIFLADRGLRRRDRAAEPANPSRWLTFGVVLGVAGLVRPVILTWLPTLWLLTLLPAFRTRANASGLLITTIAVAALTVPWIVRNDLRLGAPHMASQAPSILYRGAMGDGLSTPLPPDVERRAATAGEAEKAAFLRREALQVIADDPLHWLSLVPSRLCRYWIHVPDPRPLTLGNVFSITFNSLVLLLAFWGTRIVSREGRDQLWILWSCVLSVSLLHALTYAVVRYSIPAVTCVIVLAGGGLAAVGTSVASRLRRA